MLKNKIERFDYFKNSDNWEALGHIYIKNYGLHHASDLIIVKKLIDYL